MNDQAAKPTPTDPLRFYQQLTPFHPLKPSMGRRPASGSSAHQALYLEDTASPHTGGSHAPGLGAWDPPPPADPQCAATGTGLRAIEGDCRLLHHSPVARNPSTHPVMWPQAQPRRAIKDTGPAAGLPLSGTLPPRGKLHGGGVVDIVPGRLS